MSRRRLRRPLPLPHGGTSFAPEGQRHGGALCYLPNLFAYRLLQTTVLRFKYGFCLLFLPIRFIIKATVDAGSSAEKQEEKQV